MLNPVTVNARLQTTDSDELWYIREGYWVHPNLMEKFADMVPAMREITGLFPNKGVVTMPPFGKKLEGLAHSSNLIELLSSYHFLAFLKSQSSI